MSLTKELTSVLKSAQTATSLSGLSTLYVSSSGTLQRATTSSVVSSLLDVSTSYVTDFNDLTTPGIFLLDGARSPANGPQDLVSLMGIVEVIKRYSVLFVRVTTYDGSMATRVLKTTGEWTPWKVFVGT